MTSSAYGPNQLESADDLTMLGHSTQFSMEQNQLASSPISRTSTAGAPVTPRTQHIHVTTSNTDGNIAEKSPQSMFQKLRRRGTELVTPTRRVGEPPSILTSLKSIILASWVNVLLVFIPVSWALRFALPDSTSNKDTLVFVFSFLAIIPLAKLLAFATDEMSMRVGQTLAGLLNATLGNAVELIVAIIALVKCQLRVVQASLVGSVLSNLLLVLGMCFFAGGLKFSEQAFGVSATQLNSSLLTVSVIAVLLPAAFHFVATQSDATESKEILSVSRGVAIILLVIYGAYLWFQLVSHTSLYEDNGAHVIKSTQYAAGTRKFGLKPKKSKGDGVNNGSPTTTVPVPINTRTSTGISQPLISEKLNQRTGSNVNASNLGRVEEGTNEGQNDDEDEEETPQLSLYMALGLLAVVTVLVAVTAEWLVDSIDGLTESGHIKKEFVGIILLPIVGNAAEHVTAVTVSVKDKLNLSLGVAVGSSIQIALFVIPLIVTLGWILDKPLSLLFDPFESIAMFLSVLTVNYVVQDGKSNWLEGFILMCLYVILAVTFWFYPGAAEVACPAGSATNATASLL